MSSPPGPLPPFCWLPTPGPAIPRPTPCSPKCGFCPTPASARSFPRAEPRSVGCVLRNAAHKESAGETPLSFSRRKPGSRDHGALVGNQKDIEPLWPPWHGACCFFKSAWASCRQKARCAEVRAVAAAPLRLLGPRFPAPRFPGERRDPGTTEHWLAAKRTSSHHGLRGTERAGFSRAPGHRAGRRPAALRSVLWQRRHRGSWAPAFAGETKGGSTEEDYFRFPGERRDPGTAELWMATRRTSSRYGFRGTEGAGFSRAPGHRAGRRPAALRSVLWQRHHRGSWAPAFAGATKGVNPSILPAEYSLR